MKGKKPKRLHVFFIDGIFAHKGAINKKIMKQIRKVKMNVLTKHYYSTIKSKG